MECKGGESRQMSSKYLVVPSTGQQLTDGTIVMLSRFPGMKWIVHYGWYTYDNQQYQGWYFNSIPSNTVIPAEGEDLLLLTVLSTNTSNSGCDCNPHPHPTTPPGPSGGPGKGLTPEQAYELNRAWISVDTIALRDELNKRLLPDGKVVRVNRATEDGKPKYYIWNQVTESWDDFSITPTKIVEISQEAYDALSEEEKHNGDVYFIYDAESSSITEGLTKEEADKLYASKSIEDDFEDTVTKVAEEIIPDMVSKEIDEQLEGLDSLQQWQSWPTTS